MSLTPQIGFTSNPLESRNYLSKGRAKAPATCGELVQGFLDGREFLINSPIDLFAEMGVEIHDTGRIEIESLETFDKTAQAVRATLNRLGAGHLGAYVTIHRQIPRGKGLASSTSEISAAIQATAEALGRNISSAEMSEIAIGVEPSDGVYFPSVVMFDQLKGELLEVFGAPPPLAFIIVDTGGEVDSLHFDRLRLRQNAQRHEREIRTAVELVTRGFRTRDSHLVARAATLSAYCNQSVLYKAELEILLASTQELGALGVNCAHTGTVLGVMFNPLLTPLEPLLERVEMEVGAEKILGVHELIAGGTIPIESSHLPEGRMFQ